MCPFVKLCVHCQTIHPFITFFFQLSYPFLHSLYYFSFPQCIGQVNFVAQNKYLQQHNIQITSSGCGLQVCQLIVAYQGGYVVHFLTPQFFHDLQHLPYN